MDKQQAELALTVLRLSQPFSKMGTENSSYYQGRVVAQHTYRKGGVPSIRGNNEMLGYLEYILEQAAK